ncbi:GPW/gp25 family protein [Amycolatopsis sp. Hca4]|uniref:GPW/gp25 family protein n=1 Tax=unclassified Amycolatopsis TaxID=2618356 RepID=UPI0015925593|nr:GPW/gp25 family protein [Amycolatopsis sp. Hca4]QKV73728.1 GPW/gp25 family protein [Amycolatopsis sp. Hca4]
MSAESIGAGWQFPLGYSPSGGFDLARGVRRLEQSMRLVLTTYPGERLMRPEFGSRLRDYVFAAVSLDTATELSGEVRRALTRWEPRVEITDVVTRPDPDEPGLLHIDIGYRPAGGGDERNLVFPFYTVPDGEVP